MVTQINNADTKPLLFHYQLPFTSIKHKKYAVSWCNPHKKSKDRIQLRIADRCHLVFPNLREI